nr:hypothetical protein Iba_chr13cCG14110 [Ipomoea batatas]
MSRSLLPLLPSPEEEKGLDEVLENPELLELSANLDFSTSSFSETYDSSTVRLTGVENSTVFFPNSAAIPPFPQTQFFLAVRSSYC